MAGIITNVDSDIQKLSVLKKKIDDVKKALKGIDVKVDIDIAKDLEAQLKSLTGQYDTLASKIAETEKKIAISTKNINDTTEKIIKAQEAMVKASKAESDTGGGQSANVSNVQIATVQAQAAAYEDLREEIDKVLGSRAENIKRLVDEEAHIKRINAEIAQLSSKQAKVGLSKGETQRLKDLRNNLIESKVAVSQLNQSLRNEAKISQSAADSMTRLSQELGRMRMAYREMTEEGKSSPFGQTLKASIDEADKRIKELDASIGNHQRNVGNYANSWNGLSFSIQQLAREMPALAYGPTVFFSAISNNLPMLADEIKRARAEYDAMVKSGQKGVPVWKQVVKSIVSWQTLLVAGITILTMHGDKIIEWIGKLFQGANAALSAEKALKKLNKELDYKDLGSDIANFQRLVNLYRDLGDNANEKQQFLKDYKEEIEKTGVAVSNINDADKLFIQYSDKFIKAMALRAQATAAMKLASEQYEEQLRLQFKNEKKIQELELRKKEVEASDKDKYFQSHYGETVELSKTEYLQTIQEEIDKLNGNAASKAGETYLTIMENINKEAEALWKEMGLTSTNQAQEQAKAEADAKRLMEQRQAALKKAEDIVLAQMIANQDSELSLMSDGADKKIKQIELEYDRQIEAIEKKEAEVAAAQAGKLTGEQQAVFAAAKNLEKQKRDIGIAAVMNEETESLQKLYKDYQSLIDKYIETERKFNQDRAKLVASGASKETIAELDYQQKESLDSISLELAKRQETFKAWMDTITEMSLEELRRALVLAKQELDLLEKQNPNSKKAVEARGNVAYLDQQLQSAQGRRNSSTSLNKTNDDWKELYRTLREVESQFKEIGNAIGGTVGEVISSAGEIATLGLTMIENIGTISEMTTEGIDKTALKASQSIQMVERASVILAIIGAAVKVIAKIVNLANEIHDKKHEQRIEKMQNQVEALERSYKKLGDEIEKAFSKSASRLIEQQNRLLEQQKKLINQQILEEHAKKKSDDDKIASYKEKLDEINDTIAENKGKAEDAIYGESIQQAIENFAEAYADALGKNEDSWVSLKDTAKEMMQKMVKQTIKDAIATSGAIEKLRAQLKEFYLDDVLSLAEQEYIYMMANEIQRELDRQFAWAEGLFKDGEDKTTTEQKATYGGFETMSEETGTELNGRFTALQMAGEEIKREAIAQTVTLSEIKGSIKDYLESNGGTEIKTSIDNILTFVSQSYMELQQINENTAANVKELKSVSSYIKKWDNKIMSL